MSDILKAAKEALARVSAYLARRDGASGFDRDEIHTFDAGCSGQTVLLAGDISAIIARNEQAEAEAAALREEVARLREALAPFDSMAGAMFARNWNKDGVAISFVEPDGPIRLTFADFFAVRAALTIQPRRDVRPEETALEEQIEKLRNLCDCDCDDEDCVRCAHYPAILEQKKEELARIRSALTAEPLGHGVTAEDFGGGA